MKFVTVRGLSMLAAGILSLLTLASCSDSADNPSARQSPSIENGLTVLRKANGTEPQTLDPHRAEDVSSANILRDLYEGLVLTGAEGPRPGVAERWEISPDGLRYVFHLRPTARWSNGDPVVAGDFVAGMRTMTTAGDALGQSGMAAHVYVANRSMTDDHFFNADAEMLVVPQVGRLNFVTEMGVIELRLGEIAVLPRGLVFKVELLDPEARGYVCENYGAKFTMPDRGPIGANCLANPRDFKTPQAWFEEREEPCRLIVKWCGGFHTTELDHSPLDVVAWHGNYAPYKYDLATFSPVGAILFDHPDPSIFTVLTAPSGEEGTANVDFVIFPPRWMVAENTFRPPWYHRNIMSEFMGLIHGQYDAKEEGFVPGGVSLHNMMLAHGPDAPGFEKASTAELKPVKLDNTMAFMFETRFPQMLTRHAAESPMLQQDYIDCWKGLKKRFNGTPEGDWN